MPHSVLLLNGPNLNLLGTREPAIYGTQTLDDITRRCEEKAASLNISLTAQQSNHEGELVTWIQESREAQQGIILNAGAFTHTSIAIRDALAASGLPVIEVHLSNIHRRESFRHLSLISDIAVGGLFGLGAQGYLLALDAMAEIVGQGDA